ncbi:MAG: DUF2807 domain-containing protein [Defluviitaleaceae bacterium]|nr:DUF2807 domain-containing protein [Defluviitaleaceae bacterium]
MKKRIFITAILLLAALAIFTGCISTSGGLGSVRGRGSMVSNTLNARDFTAIDISGGFEIIYRQSNNFSVTLEIQDNLFEHVNYMVRGDTLRITTSRNFNTSRGNTPRLYINAPYLNILDFAGAVTATNWDTLDADRISISVAGAANIDIDINAQRLDISTAGASSITLSGSADRLDISAAGASNVEAFNLITQDALINIAGAGHVEVYASSTLDVTISGVGSVRYDGNPTLTRSTAGLGSIRPRN